MPSAMEITALPSCVSEATRAMYRPTEIPSIASARGATAYREAIMATKIVIIAHLLK